LPHRFRLLRRPLAPHPLFLQPRTLALLRLEMLNGLRVARTHVLERPRQLVVTLQVEVGADLRVGVFGYWWWRRRQQKSSK